MEISRRPQPCAAGCHAHSARCDVEITKQVAQYAAWTKRPGHVVSGSPAFTAALAPGDIISVVNGGPTGPLSGHVATVVQAQGDRIVYASGNAAGIVAFEGAVRLEEVTREQPPAGWRPKQVLAARPRQAPPSRRGARSPDRA